MKARSRSSCVRFFAGTTLALCAGIANAWAALGLPAASIAQDGVVLQSPQARAFAAQVQTANGAGTGSGYSTQFVQDGSIAVAEYVNAATDQVFAVRWSGPSMPDLQQLLNSTNFLALRQAQLASRQARPVGGAVDITLADLVYRAYGHMGDFRGYAYQPSGAPQGFDPAVLAR